MIQQPHLYNRLRYLVQPKAFTSFDVWGYFPQIAVTSSSGLIIMAAVYTAGRFNLSWALDFFWLGLLIIYIPAFIRLLMQDTSRRERFGIVLITTLAMFMVKVLHSPASYTYNDEFIHWRSVSDILTSGKLFTPNPLLPVAPLYPALHLSTVSIAQVTGLDIFGSGLLVLLLVRFVLAVALFMFYEYVSGSSRTAGLAVLLYMCNTNFVYFMSQFAYESLALPLSILLVVVIIRRREVSNLPRLLVNLSVVLVTLLVVWSHHLTAYMLSFFLIGTAVLALFWSTISSRISRIVERLTGWSLYRRVFRRFIPADETITVAGEKGSVSPVSVWTAVFVAAVSAAWMLFVATPTAGYLQSMFVSAFSEAMNIITGVTQARALFTSEGGNVRPLWEQITAYVAVGFTALAFPYGVIEIWRRHREKAVSVMMVAASGLYFFLLLLRFTGSGWEISNRSSEFLFIGTGFMMSIAIFSLFKKWQNSLLWLLGGTMLGTVLFVGGLLSGWAYWARVPGAYMVGADMRSIEEEGLFAANWAEQYLPPQSRMIVDRTNGQLMSTYGNQYIIRNGLENIQSAPVLFSLTLGDWEYHILSVTRTEYILVDFRLTTDIPEVGYFVEGGEPQGMDHVEPISPIALKKFDTLDNVNRIFDSGNIVIYDARAIQINSQTP